MNLAGKVAVVTGGASGIGSAVVESFARAGAAGIVIADVDSDAAQEIARRTTQEGDTRILGVLTDVSSPQSVKQMVDVTMDRFGHIDILINNAGICPVVPWDSTTIEDWSRILDVNLTGAFICTKAVLPVMRDRHYGRIVYISSSAAFLGSLVAHVAYGVSKAGMIAMMKSVAKEFGAHGINANAVAPGTIDTPLTDRLGGATKHRLAQSAPLRRQGTPKEVANAVLFLSSSCADYVNGATLHVNGGSLLV